MANTPPVPGGGLGPGGVTDPNQFPQWGANKTTQKVIEAKTNADKVNDIGNGYDAWFTSSDAAKSWLQEQQSFLGSGSIPGPFSSIQNALSAFYDVVTNGKMWRSLGWLILGVLLIIFGIVLWIGPTAFKATPIGRVASLAGA